MDQLDISVWGISDDYAYLDPDLCAMLRAEIEPLLMEGQGN